MTSSRLKSPNSIKGKKTVRVTFNKRVTLDDGSEDLPLNYMLENDRQESAEKVDFRRVGVVATRSDLPRNKPAPSVAASRTAPELPSPEESPPAPPPRLSSTHIVATSQSKSLSLQTTHQVKLLKYENMDKFLETLRNQENSQKIQETW